jgi:hypothetical protein
MITWYATGEAGTDPATLLRITSNERNKTMDFMAVFRKGNSRFMPGQPPLHGR